MRKKLILILLLISIILLYLANKNNTTLDKELSDFAIEDTSSIQQVYFADKLGNEVIISRENNQWLVNKTFIARKEAVEFMLKTIKDIEVKHPVSNSLHDRIIKNMATSAVKVEIFTNDRDNAYKTYYVGSESKDLVGSYMLLKNSSRAFVVYIPGFNGFLAPRYAIDGTTVSEDLWRDRSIFSYKTNEIKSVKVINHEDSNSSFTIHQNSNNFSLTKNGFTKLIPYDQGQTYFNLFESVKCEGFMNSFSKKDSILSSQPFHTIHLTLTDGTIDSLITYHKEPKRSEYVGVDGKKLKYDPDRMFANYNSDLMLIQFYVFDKILLRTSESSVEK